LLLEAGRTWATIRDKLDCNDAFIDRWSKRFAEERLAGLFSRHAWPGGQHADAGLGGAHPGMDPEAKPPDGSTQWSTRKLVAQLKISHMMVARVGPSTASSPIGSVATWHRTTRTSRRRPRTSSGCI